MTRSDAMILGGILKRVGKLSPTRFVDDFDQRLVLQKTIYLLQAFGLYLGYPFNWYIRGPYSPKLTRDAYSLLEVYDQIPAVRFADNGSENRFLQFLGMLNAAGQDNFILELLASVHFIYSLEPTLNRDDLFRAVKKKKPKVDRSLFSRVTQILSQYALLPGGLSG